MALQEPSDEPSEWPPPHWGPPGADDAGPPGADLGGPPGASLPVDPLALSTLGPPPGGAPAPVSVPPLIPTVPVAKSTLGPKNSPAPPKGAAKKLGDGEAARDEVAGDLPPWSQPDPKTGYAEFEYPGWNPRASREDQAAAFAAWNESRPTLGRPGSGGPPPLRPSDWAPTIPGLGIPAASVPAFPPSHWGAPSDSAGQGPIPDAISGSPGVSPDAVDALSSAGGELPAGTTPRDATADVQAGETQRASSLANNPEALALANQQHAEAQRQFFDARIVEEATKQKKEADANWNTYVQSQAAAQQKSEQLQADAMKLANAKTDPDRWFHNRSTAQHIAGFLSAIVGGMAGAYLGTGKNVALDAISKAIDRDVDAQKEDFANQRTALGMRQTAIGQMFAQGGDMYHAAEVHRLASWEMVARQIQTEAQNFDPKGTTYLGLANTLADVRGRQAAAVQSYKQQVFKNTMDVAEQDRKFRADQETARKNKAGEAIDWYKATQEAKKPNQAELDRQDKLAGRAIGGVVTGMNPDGTVKRDFVRMKDGSVFIPKDEKDAEAIKKAAPHVNDVNRLANQLARDIADLSTIDKSSKLATAKHQQLIADKEDLLLALHGARGIEGFRGNVLEHMENTIGGLNVDAIGRDATAGILRGRDNINAGFTSQLHVAGWDGDRYAPADTSKSDAPPVNTPDERTYGKLTEGQTEVHHESILGTPELVQLTSLQSRFLAGGPDGQAAGDIIERLAKDSQVPQIRAYAANILQRAADQSFEIPSGSDDAVPDYAGKGSAAHETIPPAPAPAPAPAPLYPQPRGTLR